MAPTQTRTAMNTRKIVIGAVLLIIGLPVVLVLIAAVSISVLNRTNGAIISSGQKRAYLLYVPKSYDRAKPTPLVISMHGALLFPAAQMRLSEWNRVADEHGFIVVYPSGTGVWLKIWPMRPEADLMADVRFISELIDTLRAAYNIDPTRIYANGASNGGAMAYALSCKLSDRIAAVGTVSAGQIPLSWCAESRPMPLITFHGTADPIAPYNGGRSSRASPTPFPSVSTWAANWAGRNRCGLSPIESVVAVDV